MRPDIIADLLCHLIDVYIRTHLNAKLFWKLTFSSTNLYSNLIFLFCQGTVAYQDNFPQTKFLTEAPSPRDNIPALNVNQTGSS